MAPLVIDGAINGDLVRADVEQPLAQAQRPGDGLLLGNRVSQKVHQGVGGRRGGRGRACGPAPGLTHPNPVELTFNKLKRMLRWAAERTVAMLWAAIGRPLDEIRSAECRNYPSLCGHTATLRRRTPQSDLELSHPAGR